MTRKVSFTGIALMLLLCLAVLAAGCAEGFPAGEWALDSEPEVCVLRVDEGGSAQYNGAAYTWEDDGGFLLLTDAEGEVFRLRYLVTEKHLYLYLGSGYTRKEGTAGEGIVGVWNKDGSARSFFEFTAKDTFLEDGYFSGVYETDYENGSFTLIYPKYFEDTVCYFQLDGEHMTVEYPWSLTAVRTDP